ncbi:MAG: hypothetical protein K0B16_10655 [Burkholderiaceae bacterium]|nr:hypothetical protein [Burkholderiaceae bacterium]
MSRAQRSSDPSRMLAERVRARRLRRGLSLHALAVLLAAGADQGALVQRLFRLERAKRPELQLAAEVAHALGIPLAALVAASALDAALYIALDRLTRAQRLRLLLRWRRASSFPKR